MFHSNEMLTWWLPGCNLRGQGSDSPNYDVLSPLRSFYFQQKYRSTNLGVFRIQTVNKNTIRGFWCKGVRALRGYFDPL